MEEYILYFTIALALAMDAFAVSMAAGAYYVKSTSRQQFRLAFHFGLFQFLMPIIGWLLGSELINMISGYDHWAAFIILSIIGAKMIYDGLTYREDDIKVDISKGIHLLLLSLATSIDALAVGFSLGIINEKIILPSVIIGIVAALMTLLGIKLGEKLSSRLGGRVSIFGGLILIVIGTKILNDHIEFIRI